MQTVAHAIMQRLKCLIPRAMTRIESNPRVPFYQPGGQSPQLLPCLLVVQQMEATHHRLYKKIISNIQEVIARNGRIIAIVTQGDTDVKDLASFVIEIPETLETLVPLLSVIPLQLIAYHVAVVKGLNVDMPRNLAKSVTVE